MITQVIDISLLTPNKGQIEGVPSNPRRVDTQQLDALKQSLTDDPEMMEARELLVYPLNGKYVIIGGNARYAAAKALGWDSMPCKVLPEDMPAEKIRAISIKDNVLTGSWDIDALLGDFTVPELDIYGFDLGNLDILDDKPRKSRKRSKSADDDVSDDESEDKEAFYRSMLTDCLYESDNEFDIPTLRLDTQAGKLQLPFAAYGAENRQKKGIATYHFYVEDYRFEAIWKDPAKVLCSGCVAIVEPNLSLFDTTPVAYGLQQIYKKRWISRYFQECGIGVYADLNVSHKFYDYNRMGIPAGYDAFCTRGYADRLAGLEAEHQIAREISGKDTPNLIVYGGGKKVKEYCTRHNLLYVEQLMTSKRENG